MLDEWAKNWPSLQIVVMDETNTNSKGMLWRMKPLWDNDVRHFFPRDIDAVPIPMEIKATIMFLKSKLMFHSMRSHPRHTLPLMGGLCGFFAERIRKELPICKTFEELVQFGSSNVAYCKAGWKWGSDQFVLDEYFVKRVLPKSRRGEFLNSPLGNKIGRVGRIFVESTPMTETHCTSVKLDGVNMTILKEHDRIINYAGEIFTAKPELLQNVLSIDSPCVKVFKGIVQKYDDVKQHYRISI